MQFNFNETKYLVQIVKCKLQMKTNKNERGILGGLNLASLICAFLPRAWDIDSKLKVIMKQHYRIMLAASLEKICSHILGGVATIRLII